MGRLFAVVWLAMGLWTCAAEPIVGRPLHQCPPERGPTDILWDAQPALPADLKSLASIAPVWSQPGASVEVIGFEDRLIEYRSALGELRAVDIGTGEELWHVGAPVSLRPGQSDPLLVGRRVLLKTPGWLTMMDAQTGKIVWDAGPWKFQRHRMFGRLQVTALGDDLVVIVPPEEMGISGTGEGVNSLEMARLSGATGAERWRVACGAPRCEVLYQTERALVVLRGSKELAWFSAKDGALMRSRALEINRADVVAVTPQGVALVQEGKALSAVSLDDGRALWTQASSAPFRARVVGGQVILAQGQALRALEMDTGRERWTLPLPEEVMQHLSQPTAWASLDDGVLMVPLEGLCDAMGALLLVGLERGEVALRAHVGAVKRVIAMGEVAVMIGAEGWSAGRWRQETDPVRATLGLEQDVRVSLEVLAGQAPPDGLAFPRDSDAAFRWLVRLGDGHFKGPLLERWEVAGWADIPTLTVLMSRLPLDEALAPLQRRLRQTWGQAPSLEVARSRTALLKAFGQEDVGVSQDELLGGALEWLDGFGGGLDGLRASGQPPKGLKDKWVRRWQEDRAVLTSTEALVRASARAKGGVSAKERLLKQAIGRLGPAPICAWPRPVGTPDVPWSRRFSVATCRPTQPPPGVRYDPTLSWALWRSDALGVSTDLWVMRWQKGQWSRPHYVPGAHKAAGWPDSIKSVGQRLELEWPDGHALSVNWSVLSRDRDRDGWPDLLEGALGTDPKRADTDADGVKDALDPSPTCASAQPTGKGAARKVALEHLVSLRQEPQPLYVLEAGQCVSVETIGGPVVWMERSALKALERREGFRALEVLTLGLPREADGGLVEVDYRFSQGPEVLCSGVVALVPDEGGRWRVQEWFARESWCR